MKTVTKFALILLVACCALPAFATGTADQYIYIRSNSNLPWGQSTNEAAMNSVFGQGNWTQMYYETLSVGDLTSANVKFIFMEGGDSSFSAFKDFIQNHSSPLYNWVSNGGRLLILAAPNDPLSSTVLYLPDNVILTADAFYASAASSAYAVDISNPIFSGPYSTAYNFTGDYFAHGFFQGASVHAIMQSNLNEVVLGQDQVGIGLMVFGGLTTDNFHLPQPAAHSLVINTIYYTATVEIY
jgi:hypothetical protein